MSERTVYIPEFLKAQDAFWYESLQVTATLNSKGILHEKRRDDAKSSFTSHQAGTSRFISDGSTESATLNMWRTWQICRSYRAQGRCCFHAWCNIKRTYKGRRAPYKKDIFQLLHSTTRICTPILHSWNILCNRSMAPSQIGSHGRFIWRPWQARVMKVNWWKYFPSILVSSWNGLRSIDVGIIYPARSKMARAILRIVAGIPFSSNF